MFHIRPVPGSLVRLRAAVTGVRMTGMRRSSRNASAGLFPIAAIVLCGGCGQSTAPIAPSDAAAAEGSSISPNPEASSMRPDSGDAGGLVEPCQQLARQFAANCSAERPPDVGRACLWTAYAHLCATGNAQLLLDSMNCFQGNPSCWTFGDCNTACACLAGVHRAEQSAVARAFIAKQCNLCGGASCGTVTGRVDVLPYLPDSVLNAFDACFGNTCSNSDAGAHCVSVWPELTEFACGA
jgi:hypothetical protein